MHVRFYRNCVDIQLSDNDLMRLREVLDVLADNSPHYQGTILAVLRKIIKRYEDKQLENYEGINLDK